MKKIFTWLIYAICSILLMISFAIFVLTYDKYKKAKGTVSSLEKELYEKKSEIQRLKKELEALHKDPDAVEKVAREKYTLCEDGEIIYTYTPEKLKIEK
jgi:cell division protein FtsB